MGQFGKALGRELGKNTGRAISNKVFGDGHASKHAHSVKMGRLQSQKAEAEAEEAKSKAKVAIEDKRIKQEVQAFESNQIDTISNITFSSNESELANQLNQIISLISGQKSRRVKKSGIEKIDYGITMLNSPGQKQFFEKKLKSIKFRFNLGYYLSAAALAIVFIGVLLANVNIVGVANIGGVLVIIGGAVLVILLFRGLFKLQNN